MIMLTFLIERWRMGIAAAVAAWIVTLGGGGAAVFRLSDLDGRWQGIGSERASPMESAQPVTCQSTIQADATRMVNDTTCTGEAGLRRVSSLMVTLDGNDITGTLDQSTWSGGSSVSPTVLKGSVSGRRTEDGATLQVRFPGFMPNATVTFKILNPSSFSVQATALGIQMMQVTYNKIGKR
jgi:hypothetical protein